MNTQTSDIEFKGVQNPNKTFEEYLLFIVHTDLVLQDYYFESPSGVKYDFNDIFLKNTNAKKGDQIKIYSHQKDSIVNKYQTSEKEFIGSINNLDSIGQKQVTVYKK